MLILIAASYFQPQESINVVELALCLMVAALHLISNVSRNACRLVLEGVGGLVDLIYTIALTDILGAGHRPEEFRSTPKLPVDIRTVLSRLNLEPVLQYSAQCPACGKQHDIVDGEFPEFCTQEDEEGIACGEPLGASIRFRGHWVPRPRKPIPRQSIADWVGRMLCRPYWEASVDRTSREATVKDPAGDIWDTPFIHAKQWKDELSFATTPKDDLKLVFTLAIDWFNAHHSPVGKKVWSVGAIYLVCLNLPAAERYRPENICLYMVIPGPRKPSPAELDFMLEPLVTELLQFWETGKKYTRTRLHAKGRRVWALLLLLIADLDACRGIAGFGNIHSKYCCSYCYIDLDSLANFDTTTWQSRSGAEHLAQAEQYRTPAQETNSDTRGKKSTPDYGARPSQLNRLPYWDPVKQMVPEPAHIVLLGNLQRHCRVGFQMNVSVSGGDGSKITIRKPPSKETMARARLVFATGKDGTGKYVPLQKLGRAALYALCVEHGIIGNVEGRLTVVSHLVEALEQQVSA